jgi:hypothetical protein
MHLTTMMQTKNFNERQVVNWLNRILGSAPPRPEAPTHSTGFYDLEGKPVPLSMQGDNLRLARELVRNAAQRTAAAFGIPSNWLSYEVVTIADEQNAYFQLQVALRFWDEQLWAQSGAFEQQVYKRVREDDANVARAVRAVLWRILPDAGCPYDELSDAQAWKPEAVKARTVAYQRLQREFAPNVGSAGVAGAASAATAVAATGSTAATSGTIPSVASGIEHTATQPVPLLPDEDPRYSDTRPSSFNHDFAATQPFDPNDHPSR